MAPPGQSQRTDIVLALFLCPDYLSGLFTIDFQNIKY